MNQPQQVSQPARKVSGELVDDEFLRRLYAILVTSDMGGDMARQIRDRIGQEYRARKVKFDEILAIIAEEIRQPCPLMPSLLFCSVSYPCCS